MGYSQLTNNVVIGPGEQRRDSAIHIHASVLPQNPLPSRLLHKAEQSSMCYTVGPCCPPTTFISIARKGDQDSGRGRRGPVPPGKMPSYRSVLLLSSAEAWNTLHTSPPDSTPLEPGRTEGLSRTSAGQAGASHILEPHCFSLGSCQWIS